MSNHTFVLLSSGCSLPQKDCSHFATFVIHACSSSDAMYTVVELHVGGGCVGVQEGTVGKRRKLMPELPSPPASCLKNKGLEVEGGV